MGNVSKSDCKRNKKTTIFVLNNNNNHKMMILPRRRLNCLVDLIQQDFVMFEDFHISQFDYRLNLRHVIVLNVCSFQCEKSKCKNR